MKRMIISITFVAFCLIFFSAGRARSWAQEPQTSKSAWGAKVVQASQPAKVSKRGGRAAREYPSSNRQWLFLTVEMKPPQKEADIPLEGIRVVSDSGGVFPVVAVDSPAKESPDPMFFFIEDAKDPQASGVFLLGRVAGMFDKKNRAQGSAILDGDEPILAIFKSGTMKFLREKATTLFLLFETPVTPEPLYFQFGDAARIPGVRHKSEGYAERASQ